jgi:hypothetical protein
MKYREISSYTSGEKKVIATITLKGGVIGYEGIPDFQKEEWETYGIRAFSRNFKPQEDPEGFLRWLHLEDTSYSKTSPIYDDGED